MRQLRPAGAEHAVVIARAVRRNDVGGRRRRHCRVAESADLVGARAGGLHARTIEILDQRWIVDRFLAQGQAMQVAWFAHVRIVK